MSKKSVWVIGVVIILIVLAAVFLFFRRSASQTGNAGDKMTIFAKCLKDKGAIFYGAFWCAHCQNQKAMFGSAASALPYVECSTPDSQGQTAICRQKNIPGYPTWEFKDGTKQEGEQTLVQLSSFTGCPLPQ